MEHLDAERAMPLYVLSHPTKELKCCKGEMMCLSTSTHTPWRKIQGVLELTPSQFSNRSAQIPTKAQYP